MEGWSSGQAVEAEGKSHVFEFTDTALQQNDTSICDLMFAVYMLVVQQPVFFVVFKNSPTVLLD